MFSHFSLTFVSKAKENSWEIFTVFFNCKKKRIIRIRTSIERNEWSINREKTVIQYIVDESPFFNFPFCRNGSKSNQIATMMKNLT